jgi:hypothetical protein
MKQLDPNKLCIARPSSWKTEFACMGSYMYQLGDNIRANYPELRGKVCLYEVHESRIVLMRNMIVAEARKRGCGKIFMIDPDARLDFYVRESPDYQRAHALKPFLRSVQATGDQAYIDRLRPVFEYVQEHQKKRYANRFRPFFDEAWAFMQAHKDDVGPCVLAVPARGCSPKNDVQVFRRTKEDKMVKIPSGEAAGLTGWHRVGAVGTHAMLIDTNVFARLEHPYFEDQYRDPTHTELWRGQDVMFCRKCCQADIPVLVNFNCWADHWQHECVRMPGAEEAPVHDIPTQWCSPPPQSAPDTEPQYTVQE